MSTIAARPHAASESIQAGVVRLIIDALNLYSYLPIL